MRRLVFTKIFVLLVLAFSSLNESRYLWSFTDEDPYEMMHAVFMGNPEISEIKPLIEGVLKKYTLPVTNEYRLKVGNMLLSLRKLNNDKVSEMELLKHIYRFGSNRISLPDQAGLSMTILLKS